ncbi:PREDICTED: septin-11-like, partial [Galeopterus variegatus]|uniref:Septin-11-like n=1 Tax=Galeopterus variegatus TaxID=482537 RepID=A0ABM0S267_GALVR
MAVAVGRPSNEELRNLSLSGHVGFDSLPDQLVNKSTSQGFCFNILCVGETGIGKSTLMDTLFNTKFESDPATHNEPGVRLKARSYELQESNVRLKLTIVDTVGFGDQINKDDRYILVFCETGIGKSTLMDTLFNTKFESDPATHNEPGVRLKARSYELQESNVRLKLTIVDTVGFGDQINKDD